MGTMTEKQGRFIRSLASERELPDDTLLAHDVDAALELLDVKDASDVITALLALPKKSAPNSPEHRAAEALALTPIKTSAREACAAIPDGTYTVVFDADESDWLTLQIAPATWAKEPGLRQISYLSGSDNELSYTGFAFLKVDGQVIFWKKFRNADSRLAAGVAIISAAELRLTAHEAFLEHAEGYALRSGRCLRCGHKLTVPASLHRGLGPVCAGIEGV